ncbi:hypothetical protein AB4Z21_37920, partial [Paenibacillus sp. MCAF20]
GKATFSHEMKSSELFTYIGILKPGMDKATINGKATFSHEMKSSELFTYIGILKPGMDKATITRNGANTTINTDDLVRYVAATTAPIEDSTTNSITTTLTINDIYETQTVLLNITMTSPAYSAWHNVYLELDISELPPPDGTYSV